MNIQIGDLLSNNNLPKCVLLVFVLQPILFSSTEPFCSLLLKTCLHKRCFLDLMATSTPTWDSIKSKRHCLTSQLEPTYFQSWKTKFQIFLSIRICSNTLRFCVKLSVVEIKASSTKHKITAAVLNLASMRICSLDFVWNYL